MIDTPQFSTLFYLERQGGIVVLVPKGSKEKDLKKVEGEYLLILKNKKLKKGKD